jgi:hypothetical protein
MPGCLSQPRPLPARRGRARSAGQAWPGAGVVAGGVTLASPAVRQAARRGFWWGHLLAGAVRFWLPPAKAYKTGK